MGFEICVSAGGKESAGGGGAEEVCEGLPSFDGSGQAALHYHQCLSPWRQLLASAAALGDKPAGKKERARERRYQTGHSAAPVHPPITQNATREHRRRERERGDERETPRIYSHLKKIKHSQTAHRRGDSG